MIQALISLSFYGHPAFTQTSPCLGPSGAVVGPLPWLGEGGLHVVEVFLERHVVGGVEGQAGQQLRLGGGGEWDELTMSLV